jgi:hypothetical protein
VGGTDDDMLWNGSEGDGNIGSVCEGDGDRDTGMAVKGMGILGVCVREMKVLTVEMETVTLIGTGR